MIAICKVRFMLQKYIIWVADFGKKVQTIKINQSFNMRKAISITAYTLLLCEN